MNFGAVSCHDNGNSPVVCYPISSETFAQAVQKWAGAYMTLALYNDFGGAPSMASIGYDPIQTRSIARKVDRNHT